VSEKISVFYKIITLVCAIIWLRGPSFLLEMYKFPSRVLAFQFYGVTPITCTQC